MTRKNRFAWGPGDLVPVESQSTRRSPNHLPALIDTLRPTLAEIGEWAGVKRGVAATWQQGAYQPKPKARAALVKAVRAHAAALLKLADAVEAEGGGRR